MTPRSLYPDPPYVTAAFYIDHMNNPDALAAVCDQVEAAGAAPTGLLEIVRGRALPRFEMISDLASALEQVTAANAKRLDELWAPRLRGLEEDVQVLRAGFEATDVGTVVVGYEPLSEALPAQTPHPVGVTASASLLSMPATVPLHGRERRQAAAVARFLLAVFRGSCEALDPLYGAIGVEQRLPSPRDLMAGGGRIGTELFVSARLLAADAGLEHDLVAMFATGFQDRWTTGIFLSGWAPFNPEGRTLREPMACVSTAARRLGTALGTFVRTAGNRE